MCHVKILNSFVEINNLKSVLLHFQVQNTKITILLEVKLVIEDEILYPRTGIILLVFKFLNLILL
jgi:hypothetical protein